MSVPQKEGPATMLRAMFAGVGSLLSVVDRMRGKSAAQSPAPTAAAPETSPAPETVTPETSVAPETVAPEASVAPETVAPEASVAPETVTPEASVTAETTAGLPLANYDESTVASLRARLRNLTVAQLTQLVEYEKGHAARADVITMFERRIAKIESEA
jgi:hypothetical protein